MRSGTPFNGNMRCAVFLCPFSMMGVSSFKSDRLVLFPLAPLMYASWNFCSGDARPHMVGAALFCVVLALATFLSKELLGNVMHNRHLGLACDPLGVQAGMDWKKASWTNS